MLGIETNVERKTAVVEGSHLLPQRRTFVEVADTCEQPGTIPRFEQQARNPIRHDFRHLSDPACDHSSSRGHVFEQFEGRVIELVQGRIRRDRDIHRGHIAWHVVMGNAAGKRNGLFEPGLSNLRLSQRTQGPVPHQKEMS